MPVNEIISFLQENNSEKYKKNVIKLGIPEKEAIGVPTIELRKLAKTYPKEKKLVDQLWKSGYHEAKIMAVLLMKPNDYTKKEIETYMDLVVSWDLCDLYCKSVIIKRKDFENFILTWIHSAQLYRKRASYSLLASMSVHSVLNEKEIEDYLSLIQNSKIPNDPLVKKAVSWALRELGKIDELSKAKSSKLAQKFAASNDQAKQWIGKDALKELETLIRVPERSRLISNKSKMGQAALKENRD